MLVHDGHKLGRLVCVGSRKRPRLPGLSAALGMLLPIVTATTTATATATTAAATPARFSPLEHAEHRRLVLDRWRVALLLLLDGSISLARALSLHHVVDVSYWQSDIFDGRGTNGLCRLRRPWKNDAANHSYLGAQRTPRDLARCS